MKNVSDAIKAIRMETTLFILWVALDGMKESKSLLLIQAAATGNADFLKETLIDLFGEEYAEAKMADMKNKVEKNRKVC